MTKDELIAFEKRVDAAWLDGYISYPFHLSGGNEDQLIRVFESIAPDDYVFSTHRSHYHYLLHGGDPDNLMQMIVDGRSMFVFDKRINFLSSSVLAGTCGIAAGVALGLRLRGRTQRVHCFVGDGACDEGHFYEAVRYVESMGLPCRFIVEDNGYSCDTTRWKRGASAEVIAAKCVERYSYERTQPHSQSADKRPVKFRTKG